MSLLPGLSWIGSFRFLCMSIGVVDGIIGTFIIISLTVFSFPCSTRVVSSVSLYTSFLFLYFFFLLSVGSTFHMFSLIILLMRKVCWAKFVGTVGFLSYGTGKYISVLVMHV